MYGYNSIFSANNLKGREFFCDFLFVCLGGQDPLERSTLKEGICSDGSKFFHLRDGQICMGVGGEDDRADFPESVTIHLKSPCCKLHCQAG